LTLNGSAVLSFKRELPSQPFAQVFVEPQSLLLFTEDLYWNAYHGIEKRWKDEIDKITLNSQIIGHPVGTTFERTLRVSLTIRVVPKLKKDLETQ